MTLTGKVIWLTGGTSGIGRELALQLAKLSNTVYISARNIEELNTLHSKSSNIIGLSGDITNKKIVAEHAKKIQEDHQYLDCLILNAGTAEYVNSNNFDSALFERVFAINFFSNTQIIQSALPLLRQGSEKYIVGISSSAIFTPLPRASAYGASKAAFSYLLDSLRTDLSHEGFKVSVVYPGFVKTPLTDKNDFPMPMRISVENAVEKILHGIERYQQYIIFPIIFCYLLKFMGALPCSWRNQLMQKFRKETV